MEQILPLVFQRQLGRKVRVIICFTIAGFKRVIIAKTLVKPGQA